MTRSDFGFGRRDLADARTGKNGQHALVGTLRQAVFKRLAGYEDVSDAERLRHVQAMRWIVRGKAAFGMRKRRQAEWADLETRWKSNLGARRSLRPLNSLRRKA